jgi:HTH-type transcriptional regulator / antitoxin HipB
MEDFTLRELIKTHRKSAGLTQKELANLAGVGKTTIFDLENDKITCSWKVVLSVLKVLNIEVQFISPLK